MIWRSWVQIPAQVELGVHTTSVLGRIWTKTRELNSNADVTSFINRAVTGRFFADAYFLTSAGNRQIFSTLNHVVKVMQRMPAGCRWETVRPLPDSFCKWQNFRLMPRRCPTTIGRRPSGDCRDACRLPADDNKSYDHRQVTVWASCDHLRVRYGWNFEIDF